MLQGLRGHFIRCSDARAHSVAHFGEGTGAIHMDDVTCTGNEWRLIDCQHTSRHNCQHFEDAGVTCNETSEL